MAKAHSLSMISGASGGAKEIGHQSEAAGDLALKKRGLAGGC
jgi:hypothetical protein